MAAIKCEQVVKGKVCGGDVDASEGVCEKCGRAPAKGALSAAAATADAQVTGTATTGRRNGTATQGVSSGGSGRISRRQNASTSKRQSELGGGLVSLPPVPSQDPMKLVMSTPEAPLSRRKCPSCGAQVYKQNGYCPQCSTAYDFRPALKQGDIVGGKYEIKGPIGLGGMGWIYLGWDVVLNRLVVLKGVLNEKDPEAAAAAIAERQFLAAVKHPNIVLIYDFVAHGKNGYMVLEFVGGRTVDAIRADLDVVDLLDPETAAVVRKDVLRKDIQTGDGDLVVQVTKSGVLSPEQAISFIMAFCPALTYLHSMGFTHNDIKPDNLMVEGSSVKLIDLGAMRRIDDEGGLIFGTDGYFAQEAKDGPVAVSDLYSLGRSLATLVMDFLYKSRTDRDQTTKRVTTNRLIVKGYKNTLPSPQEQPILRQYDSMYRLLLRATHEDPDQRFQTAEELQFQLFGILREIMAGQTGPKPADSRVFFGDRLVDGGDVAGASQPLARLLPVLRLDSDDKAAQELVALSSISDPLKRLDELERIAAKRTTSREAGLRIADALIEAGRLDEAVKKADAILAADEFEWRAHWYAGKALLAKANDASGKEAVALVQKAMGRFDRVYFEMPGELAPRVAIGMAAETAGDIEKAIRFYGLVAMVDPSIATASFGLARVRATEGNWTASAAALASVPAAHSMFIESRLALARVLVTAGREGKPDLIWKATETLAQVKADMASVNEVAARALCAAADLIEAGLAREDSAKTVLGVPLTRDGLRMGASEKYLAVGRFAGTPGEKAYWVDKAHEVRPVTLF